MSVLALDAPDLVAHRHPRRGVERRQRLVEQQRVRLEHQRASERDALLLAAGELRRQPLGEPAEADLLEHRVGARRRRSASGTPRTRSGYATFSHTRMCGNSA